MCFIFRRCRCGCRCWCWAYTWAVDWTEVEKWVHCVVVNMSITHPPWQTNINFLTHECWINFIKPLSWANKLWFFNKFLQTPFLLTIWYPKRRRTDEGPDGLQKVGRSMFCTDLYPPSKFHPSFWPFLLQWESSLIIYHSCKITLEFNSHSQQTYLNLCFSVHEVILEWHNFLSNVGERI